jgi:hypothetical protein
MIKSLLNLIPVKHGSYTQEGNQIRRTFSFGYSYIITTCKTSKEAQRIVNQFNLL